MMRILTLLALAAALPLASASAEPVPVAGFRSIELVGGGTLIVRPGSTQRVELVEGSRGVSDFEVRNGTLRIRACRTSCRDYRLRVEVTTPRVEGLAITGGGSVRVQPGFRPQDRLAVAITGGGSIDADAVQANGVAASIRGGGSIDVHARSTLTASVQGGGSIDYRGDPRVTTAIQGGGSVRPVR